MGKTHVSLVVHHMDGERTWHSLDGRGWRIDASHRTLIIGRGTDRTMIPLDGVRFFDFEVTALDEEAPPSPESVLAGRINTVPTPSEVFRQASGGLQHRGAGFSEPALQRFEVRVTPAQP